MFLAQKFCRIEQYNTLGRGEIRSAQGHVFCGSAFARYVHVLKENTMISGALRLRKIAFSDFLKKKKKGERKDFRSARISEIFCSKKRKNWKCNEKKRKNGKIENAQIGKRGGEQEQQRERREQKNKAGPYTLSTSRSPAFGGNYW